jgi:hypothetical protein
MTGSEGYTSAGTSDFFASSTAALIGSTLPSSLKCANSSAMRRT